MPKMVMKSFGKRNFMQPMGRPKHAFKAPCFFSFYVLGWGKIFIHFFRLPNVFTLCSFQVLNGFPIFPPTFFPYLLTFICFGKWCPPFTYIGGPKGKTCIVQNKAFCFGESPLFLFFLEWWANQIGTLLKKKLGRHLI